MSRREGLVSRREDAEARRMSRQLGNTSRQLGKEATRIVSVSRKTTECTAHLPGAHPACCCGGIQGGTRIVLGVTQNHKVHRPPYTFIANHPPCHIVAAGPAHQHKFPSPPQISELELRI